MAGRPPAEEATLRLRHDSARRRAGFSLLELMVTMGLAAMLLGMGAGVYVKMGRQSAATQAMRSVNLLVTQARKSSVRFPATLVCDPAENVIHPYTDEVIQELHFEARPTENGDIVPLGIEGRDCTIAGGEVVAHAGRVGGGLRLDAGSLSCGTFAAYDLEDGINAEVWLKPSQAPKCDLVTKGHVFSVGVASDGVRSGRLQVRIQVQDPSGTQEPVTRTVGIPPVRVNEWLGVRVAYDRTALVTSTSDGHGFVVRDTWKESRRLATEPDQPLVIGSGFQGTIDDVRIGGIRAAEPLRLPAGVELAGTNPPIRFLDGRLDPAVHSAPARISIAYQGKVSNFEIGQSGMVLRVVETDTVPDAAPAKPPEQLPEKKE